MHEFFRKFAAKISEVVGSAAAFAVAVLIILIWLISGPIFKFSDTWQLIINTGTTIITFLMVFMIQNSQNRDMKAVQLKLDELIHAVKGASDRLVDLEDMSDEELSSLKKHFEQMAKSKEAVEKELGERGKGKKKHTK